MLRKLLIQRKETLQLLILKCNKWLSSAPEGSLRISCSGRAVSFYLQSEKYHKEEKPLKISKQRILIEKLIRKDYYSKLIPAAKEELKAVESLLQIKDNQTLAKIFDKLHPERQKFVSRVEETRESSLENWLNLPESAAEPRSGSYYIPTERGELVRSRNEYLIANALFHSGIPYKYEFPYEAVNGKILHPDFYVRNINTGQSFFWEHFGMMDDPNYVESSFMYKMKLYAADGLLPGQGLITSFSNRNHSLEPEEIKLLIEKFLK